LFRFLSGSSRTSRCAWHALAYTPIAKNPSAIDLSITRWNALLLRGYREEAAQHKPGGFSRHNKKELVGERKKKRQDFVFFFFFLFVCLPLHRLTPPPAVRRPPVQGTIQERLEEETSWLLYWLQWCYEGKNENNFQVSPVQCVVQLLKISRRVTVKRKESDSLKLSIGMCFFSFFKHIQHTITNQSESPKKRRV
jgi:hypothetical protein